MKFSKMVENKAKIEREKAIVADQEVIVKSSVQLGRESLTNISGATIKKDGIRGSFEKIEVNNFLPQLFP